MCGSNNQQQQISDAQQQMYQNLNSNYQTTFAQQQDILKAMNAEFLPIMQAGPVQEGMTDAQKQAINNQGYGNINTQLEQAQRATAQQLAARGGGNTLLPSSVGQNLLSANTNAAALARANLANQTTAQSYALGRQNWTAATGALAGVSQMTNPLGYAGASTGAGSAASTSAYQIAQASNSVWNGAIGALGSLGGAALGNWGALFPKGAGGGGGSSIVAPTGGFDPSSMYA